MIVRKAVLLIKGGQHFCTEKKCHPPFSNKIFFVSKRRSAFLYWKKMPSPFSNKILLSLIKGRQCLRKCAPPFITKILTTAIIYLITMSNTVIFLRNSCGIPQKQMTVLLDTSLKDPLHSLISAEIYCLYASVRLLVYFFPISSHIILYINQYGIEDPYNYKWQANAKCKMVWRNWNKL